MPTDNNNCGDDGGDDDNGNDGVIDHYSMQIVACDEIIGFLCPVSPTVRFFFIFKH